MNYHYLWLVHSSIIRISILRMLNSECIIKMCESSERKACSSVGGKTKWCIFLWTTGKNSSYLPLITLWQKDALISFLLTVEMCLFLINAQNMIFFCVWSKEARTILFAKWASNYWTHKRRRFNKQILLSHIKVKQYLK